MALVRDKDGKRLHVKSRLMGESLVSKEFLDQLEIAPQQRLYPDVAVMKIGRTLSAVPLKTASIISS